MQLERNGFVAKMKNHNIKNKNACMLWVYVMYCQYLHTYLIYAPNIHI